MIYTYDYIIQAAVIYIFSSVHSQINTIFKDEFQT